MKKLLLAAIALLFVLPAFGQQLQPLPTDSTIRIGKLENGMTYYIRQNDKPAKRCEFYLATNVGAFQEEDDQDGLAHFLEHMCFNGTKNFPGKGILNYLQSIGAEFGGNINAATGLEQTTYMLNNIPLEKAGVVDSCLLIMHDYSHFVTCDPKEIDAERGVIIEEKRTRNNAGWRNFMRFNQFIFAGTPYAKRTLIGSEEQLKTFKPESLTSFYHTWYRPDMQALIVVGDINVDEIEGKIKQIFSDIPKAENPKAKPVVKIPDNDKPLIGIATDKEATSSNIDVLWKSEPTPLEYRNTLQGGVLPEIMKSILYYGMQERFNDIKAQPDAPFFNGDLYVDQVSNYCEATQASVSFKDGEYARAFRALLVEVEKLKRYGFTAGEYERATTKLISELEKEATAAETRKNPDFIRPILQHFFQNETLLDPQTELQYAQMICQQLPLDMFNGVVKQLITDNNMVVFYTGPEREGLTNPTEAELQAIIEEVKASEIAAPVEETSNEPLLDASQLAGGKLTTVKELGKGQYGAAEWTLDNGTKVVYLKTDYKKDQVLINYVKQGGASLVDVADIPSLDGDIWYLYTTNKGVADIPGTKLKKMLAGKNVQVTPYIEQLESGISASTTPKDIETAFQLIYLNYTKQRFDADEFNIGLSQIKSLLPNLEKQPDFVAQQLLYKSLYCNNPRRQIISSETVDKISLATLEKVYKQLFNGADGATLYVVGNVDEQTLRPLVEKYIGSIEKGKKAVKWVDNNIESPKGKTVVHEPVQMETPKCKCYVIYNALAPYSVENAVLLEAANYILDMTYTETLREEEGGTYGAGVVANCNDKPKERHRLLVTFDTNVQQAPRLLELVREGINGILEKGITDDQFSKTVENLKKNIPEKHISNSYWSKVLKIAAEDGYDYDAQYQAAVDGITKDKIVKALKTIIDAGNELEFMIYPKE
ncbi:MAG: insulinase family protein [Bacteroidales bacterium]|nr:insulinase family protein [Bacteroidales bacterium]